MIWNDETKRDETKQQIRVGNSNVIDIGCFDNCDSKVLSSDLDFICSEAIHRISFIYSCNYSSYCPNQMDFGGKNFCKYESKNYILKNEKELRSRHEIL